MSHTLKHVHQAAVVNSLNDVLGNVCVLTLAHITYIESCKCGLRDKLALRVCICTCGPEIENWKINFFWQLDNDREIVDVLGEYIKIFLCTLRTDSHRPTLTLCVILDC